MTPSLTYRFALIFIAVCAGHASSAAQNTVKTNCVPAKSMKAEQLFGQWKVNFDNPPAPLPKQATMRLERHAEFSDSLAGVIKRDIRPAATVAGGHAATAALAGDLDEGLLLLDESSDNVAITGTWNGEMVEGSCGRIFRGSWKDTSANAPADAPDVRFTLTKIR